MGCCTGSPKAVRSKSQKAKDRSLSGKNVISVGDANAKASPKAEIDGFTK